MGNAVSWIKANPLTVLAVAMAIVAAALLGYVHLQRSALVASAGESPRQVAGNIDRLTRTAISIPGARPDDPPEQVTVVANTAVRDALSAINSRLEGDALLVEELVTVINQTGDNQPVFQAFERMRAEEGFIGRLMNRDERQTWLRRELRREAAMNGARTREPMNTRLFQIAGQSGELRMESGLEDALRIAVPPLYRAEVLNLLVGGSAPVARPGIRAGVPVTREELQERIDADTRFFLNNELQFPKTIEQLDESERQDLIAALRRSVASAVAERARTIGIYVDSLSRDNPAFPIPTSPFADINRPTAIEIFFAQLDLWMYEDFIDVIRLVNRTDDAESNAATAPIKRLIRLQALPGLVGMPTIQADAPAAAAPGPGGFGGGPTAPDASQQLRYVPLGSGVPQMPVDFAASPTGRVSVGPSPDGMSRLVNPVFDVRHLRVDMIVDSQRLHEVLQAINQVNLMTTLEVNLTQVDEYAALREGFWYGEDDCVQVSLLIETLWVRSWMLEEIDGRRFMPRVIKEALRITEDQPGQQDW